MKMSLCPAILSASLIASLAALPMPAAGQPVAPGQEGELGKLLPPAHGRKVCFARSYDAGHLAKHPKQKVTSLILQLAYHRHKPQKDYPEGQRNYYFGMAATIKGQKRTLYASGECTPSAGKIRCRIECDGGGVDLLRHRTADALTVSFEDAESYLRMSVGCGGEEEAVNLTPGADDRRFRLDKAPLSRCRALDGRM